MVLNSVTFEHCNGTDLVFGDLTFETLGNIFDFSGLLFQILEAVWKELQLKGTTKLWKKNFAFFHCLIESWLSTVLVLTILKKS